MSDLVLTVDCSTTASKCVIWDLSGRAVSEGATEIPLSIPEMGWGEQDPKYWWQATRSSIKQALSSVDGSKVKAIAITHQRESFACLDEAGEPLRPAMLWLDNRATSEVREFGTAEVFETTGKPPNPTPAFYKLLWIKKNQPEVIANTKMVVDVHGYILNQLTGKYASSIPSADPLGVIDLKSGSYSTELISKIGLAIENFPTLYAPGEVIAGLRDNVATDLGLSPETVVVAGSGDGQAAGLGAGVIEPGKAYLNLGTGLIAGIYSQNYQKSVAYRAMAGSINGSFNYELFIGAGTYMVNWFKTNFATDFQYNDNESAEQYWQRQAAEIEIGCNGLFVIPYWNGALTPYWDSNARGVLVGFAGVHSKAHIYRAILEGIAYELRVCMELANQTLQTPVTEIIAMGGGSRSPLWNQMIADVLSIPVFVSKEEEATSLGAAMLAAYGNGSYDSIAEASKQMSASGAVYQPNKKLKPLYDVRFEIYKAIYPALKSSFAAIAEVE